MLGVWCGGGTVESRNPDGSYTSHARHHGPLNLFPSGSVPGVRRRSRSDFILIGLDPRLVYSVQGELEQQLGFGLQLRQGFHDPTITRLVSLLTTDAKRGFQLGVLFADHLIHALTVRLLLLGERKREEDQRSSLPQHLLRRVLDVMHESMGKRDLNLETLASEAGYSRRHFLRMFRAATGHSPHQHLLQLRLDHAATLLRNGMPIIDIADACGFSSHSHMSRAFHQRFGQTPMEFRRTA
jgi:AraC family transcriptional regulator